MRTGLISNPAQGIPAGHRFSNNSETLSIKEPVIDELARVLGESVNQMRALRERAGYQAHPNSRLVERATGSREELGADGATALIGYEIAATQIAAAEDHIAAMSQLLAHRTGQIAPLVLARAAIEASARASYMIDPAVAERDRASAVIAERIHELEQRCQLIRGHDPEGTSPQAQDDLAEALKSITELRAFAKDENFPEPRRKSFTFVVTRALTTSIDNKLLATTAVAAYSALAHAVPELLLTQSVDRSNPEWGWFEVGLTNPNTELIFDAALAVMLAYSAAVNHQVRAFGWPSDEWAAWLNQVRGAFARYVGGSEEDFKWHVEKSRHSWGIKEEDMYSIPIPPALQGMLTEQRQMFTEKFGRPPGPDDPLFFDPEQETPRPMWMSQEKYVAELLELIDLIGQLTPAREFAIRRCGFVASTHSWPHLPIDKQRDWKAALYEYYTDLGESPSEDFDLLVLPSE
jgi:hypothetical protein